VTSADPEETWRELEKLSSGVGLVERRVDAEARLDIHLAVRKPENLRCLLVSAHGTPTPMPPPVTTRGLEWRLLPDADQDRCLLLVTLNEAHFSDIFTALAGDLIGRLRHAPDDAGSLLEALARLERWRRLLEAAGADGLGWEHQIGLYGELWFLREHLLGTLDASTSCKAWVGPDGAHQDFQFAGCAVEVKVTGTKQPQRLRITSERQLDGAGVLRLFLFHLSIDQVQGSADTLPALVDSVRRSLEGLPGRELFEERLLSAGYSDVHREGYARTGVGIRETNLFEVAPGFPRILERDLPAGVGDVQYSVSVSACQPFAVGAAVFRSVLLGVDRG
jgi:hypothetical protein